VSKWNSLLWGSNHFELTLASNIWAFYWLQHEHCWINFRWSVLSPVAQHGWATANRCDLIALIMRCLFLWMHYTCLDPAWCLEIAMSWRLPLFRKNSCWCFRKTVTRLGVDEPLSVKFVCVVAKTCVHLIYGQLPAQAQIGQMSDFLDGLASISHFAECFVFSIASLSRCVRFWAASC